MKNLGIAAWRLGMIWGLFLVCGRADLMSQDQIFTLDGRTIPCKINTIEKKISYHIYSNLSGPLYVIRSKEVGFIQYENGDIQAFNRRKRKYIPFQHKKYDLVLLPAPKLLPIDVSQVNGQVVEGISVEDPSHPFVKWGNTEVLGFWGRNKSFVALDDHKHIRDALFRVELPTHIYERKVLPKEEAYADFESVFTADVSVDTSAVPAPIFEEPKVFEIDEDEFKRKAVAKVGRLTQYISLISDKETAINRADKAINEALILFVSDTCVVQVSSIKKPKDKPREEFIRRYLQNLKSLLYDKVEIEWADINYVSDLKKDPSGNYWGMVSFLQRFKGFRDGKVAYSDRVTKNVKVWFKSYEKFTEGMAESLWDVLLSDIMVEQTELY